MIIEILKFEFSINCEGPSEDTGLSSADTANVDVPPAEDETLSEGNRFESPAMDGPSPMLSTGAQVAIGVAAGVGLIALAVTITLWRYKRCCFQKRSPSRPPSTVITS